MILRTLSWTLTDDGRAIPSSGNQKEAGVQGEHLATKVVFTVPPKIAALMEETNNAAYAFYIECTGSAYDVTHKLGYDSTEKAVGYELPRAWTQGGGTATLRLLAIDVRERSDETWGTNDNQHITSPSNPVAYSAEVRIRFKDRRDGAAARERQLLEGPIVQAVTAAEQAADEAEAAKGAAELAAEEAEENAKDARITAGIAVSLVNEAKTARDEATTAAVEAGAAADAANLSKEKAEGAKAAVEAAKGAAETARDAAVSAQIAAETARDAAVSAQIAAETNAAGIMDAVNAAEKAKKLAVEAKEAASQQAAAAGEWMGHAETAADSALNSAAEASRHAKQAEELVGGYIIKDDRKGNLLDVSAFEARKSLSSNNGSIKDGNYYVTDYIYVEEGLNYAFFVQKNGAYESCESNTYVCFYDANKKFIVSAEEGSTANASEKFRNSATEVDYRTAPSGAKYMRFGITETNYTNYYDTMMVLQEDTNFPVEYSEYGSAGNGATLLKGSDYVRRAELVARMKKWSGKKWAAVGDSLTELLPASSAKTDKHYHHYIAERTGITAVDMGKTGSGYAKRREEGRAFFQRIASTPDDVDVVTIFGSVNDIQYKPDGVSNMALGVATDNMFEADTTADPTTLCGHINRTINVLLAKLPKVRLGLITPAPMKGYPPFETEGNPLVDYVEKIVEICRLRGIPCLDLFHCSGLRPWESVCRDQLFSKDIEWRMVTLDSATGLYKAGAKYTGDTAAGTLVEGAMTENGEVVYIDASGVYFAPINLGCHPNEEGHALIAARIKGFLETLLM